MKNSELNIVSNISRWALLGGVFVFLLTGLFALNEVMNFQSRVTELVSDNGRARQVLVTLHNTRSVKERDDLPFAALAVQLDVLAATAEDLRGFQFADLASPEGETQTSGDGSNQPSSGPSANGDESVSEELAAPEEVQQKVARDEYEATTEALLNGLREVETLIAADASAPRLLNEVRATLDQVSGTSWTKTAVPDNPAILLEQKLDALGRLIAGRVQNGADQREISSLLDEAKTEAAALPAIELNEAVWKLRDPDQAKQLADTLDQLQAGVMRLENALDTRYKKRFQIAQVFADELYQMRREAESLQGFEPLTYRPLDGGEELVGGEARAPYEEAIGRLLNAVEVLGQRLEPRTRQVTIADIIATGDDNPAAATYKAELILNEFDTISRFDWMTAGLVDSRGFATLNADSLTLLFVMIIGAIGSLIFVAQYNLKPLIQGQGLAHQADRGLVYIIFRIFFGVVMALAVYLLVKAGQLAFGGEGDQTLGTDINRPIIAVVALLAGLLAWHALSAIESKGAAWFGAQTRKDLWATGLEHALRQSGREVGELALQIGRSVEQIERWMMFKDKVPPEMQDRMRTWLERSLSELFNESEPKNSHTGRAMWATGLKGALDDRRHALDFKTLAELLGEPDTRRIEDWCNLKLQVSTPLQWRLVDVLGERHALLFDANAQDRAAFGTGLRSAREVAKLDVEALADLVGVDARRVYRWQELDEQVPVQWQDKLVAKLGMGWSALFTRNGRDDLVFLKARGLGERLAELDKDPAGLAEEIDVEVERVEAWLADPPKPVYEITASRVAEALGAKVGQLFAA